MIKKGLAKEADKQSINDNKLQKEAEAFHVAEAKRKNKELRDKLDGAVVVIKVKSGENGKFFGSVTSKEVASELLNLGYEIDKKKILLTDNVKTPGDYPVKVKISPEETATITVKVERL